MRQHFIRYGMPRASLELACPSDQIELVQVDQPLDQPLWRGGTLVGIKGCSHRAVYVATNGGTWILNSVTNGVDNAATGKSDAGKPTTDKPNAGKSGRGKSATSTDAKK